jgi:murein DD-endopeptidase MepM/ murein hydrolase activator NlpD
MSKVAERSDSMYEAAKQEENTARALGEQAQVARQEREKKREEAQIALDQAGQAAEAASVALAEQEQQGIILDQQLKALRDTKTQTVSGYEAGVAELQRQTSSVRQPGPSAPPGSSGWTIPAYGPITDGFGWRKSVCVSVGCGSTYHQGIDIGAACSAPIYAASSGRVTFAGPSGSYGNFVRIDHGDGIATGYAHIISGGILVSTGQTVSAGQNIARIGNTGVSSGCHLHFEVFEDGTRIDPGPFMRQRGASLG